MVKLAISVPSVEVTAANRAAVAPNLAGPPPPSGSASSMCTRCARSGRASRSTWKRSPAAACRDTSMPGSAGEPGWAIHSTPRTVPRLSPRVAHARTGAAAVTRISSRLWGKGWFCPRTSSAVIASVPSSVTLRCRVVMSFGGAARTVVLCVVPGRVAWRRVRTARWSLPVGPLGGIARQAVQLPAALPPGAALALASRAYRCGRIAGIRSWNVRPLAGLPRAVICQPAPERCTLAMICAVY